MKQIFLSCATTHLLCGERAHEIKTRVKFSSIQTSKSGINGNEWREINYFLEIWLSLELNSMLELTRCPRVTLKTLTGRCETRHADSETDRNAGPNDYSHQHQMLRNSPLSFWQIKRQPATRPYFFPALEAAGPTRRQPKRCFQRAPSSNSAKRYVVA